MKRSLLRPEPSAARALLLSMLGMLIGLAWDSRGAGLQLAASLCGGSAAAGVGAALWLHWISLPAMHAGMLAGGVASALPAWRRAPAGGRCVRYADLLGCAGCSAAMLAGMTVGGLAAGHVADAFAASHAAAMLAGMFAGMVAGMAAYALADRVGGVLWRAAVSVQEYRYGQHRSIRP